MQGYYSDFFTQYCRFISKDLIATFDKRLGRNQKVINTFFKVFYAISKKDIQSEKKDRFIELLTKQIDSYLTDGDIPTYDSMFQSIECNNKHYIKPLGYLKHLQNPLNDFNEAVSDFNKLYKNQLFKQGLIEFNNALSHLFSGFCSSDTNFEKNISKASTHLHRGSLDYYKTLIKNKESFTHLQKEELIELRKLEMNSVGLEVTNNQKDKILIAYRNFARKLHNINK